MHNRTNELIYKQLVLGVDPGGTTGWSMLSNEDGYEFASGQLRMDEVAPWLQDHLNKPLAHIIIEDFRLSPEKAKAQIGSRFDTCKVIGMFELFAHILSIPITLQPRTVKPIAERFSGIRPPRNHKMSHHIDAYNHAVYWLTQQGRFTTKLMRELSEVEH